MMPPIESSAQNPLVIPLFLPHQGCPHRCIFCSQSAITGRPQEVPDANTIAREIDKHLRTQSQRRAGAEAAFYGGNFLGLPDDQIRRALDAVLPFVEDGRIDGIRFSTRPDTVCPSKLALLSGYPISTVELGVQSMDDRLLRVCGRGHTAGDSRRAAALLSDAGVRLGLQLMIGLPGESELQALETARTAARLGPDFVRLYPLLVMAHTPLATLWRRGRYRPLTLTAAVLRVKKMYLALRGKGIAVARMGLQPTTALETGGQLLAGPHHPAFGELVLSACFFDLAVVAVAASPDAVNPIVLRVHPRRESQLRGRRNANLRRLGRRFGHPPVVRPDRRLPLDGLAVNRQPPVQFRDLEEIRRLP